jgi:uncharacterized protein YdeI (YjbR/CyaY-like superfamily)
MSTKPTFFKTQAGFRAWLEKNHDTKQELLLGLYKLGSGKTGITYKQALDEALCFGWIDGIRRTIDETRWTIRFTPRKPRSIWSQVNLKRAAELEREGKMHVSGLAAFHGHDKTRTNQYSFENKDKKLDAALEKRFRANKKAWAWFTKQAPSYQHTASFWVLSAKQAATRARRLETLIHDSEQGIRVAPLRRPMAK